MEQNSQQQEQTKGPEEITAKPTVVSKDVIGELERASEIVGIPLKFKGEYLDQESVKYTLLKAFQGESADHFAVGIAKGDDEHAHRMAATDLVKKLIGKMVINIPQGAVGFVVTSPTGPGIRYDEKAVTVTTHSASKHATTVTIVQQ